MKTALQPILAGRRPPAPACPSGPTRGSQGRAERCSCELAGNPTPSAGEAPEENLKKGDIFAKQKGFVIHRRHAFPARFQFRFRLDGGR